MGIAVVRIDVGNDQDGWATFARLCNIQHKPKVGDRLTDAETWGAVDRPAVSVDLPRGNPWYQIHYGKHQVHPDHLQAVLQRYTDNRWCIEA
jgi:hypothetical protein